LKTDIPARSSRPVFVVGCHRSGTNLLYDTLLSAGGFAIYRGYLPIYKMLVPKFGSLRDRDNRAKIVNTWLRSKGYRRSGLDAASLAVKLLADAKTGGAFMRIVMEQICAAQGVSRWALYDADNVLYISRIKRDIPEALFVHIIRDGRDIANSLRKMGEFTPFFWNRRPGSLIETALYWEWIVRKGREQGLKFPADYIELRYEELVTEPQNTLRHLGEFIDHDLDFDRIQSNALGSLSCTNSSFRGEQNSERPVNRWKQALSSQQIAELERLIGLLLDELGYQLTAPSAKSKAPGRTLNQRLYTRFLEAKWWAKINTPLGKLTSVAPLELDKVSPVPSNHLTA